MKLKELFQIINQLDLSQGKIIVENRLLGKVIKTTKRIKLTKDLVSGLDFKTSYLAQSENNKRKYPGYHHVAIMRNPPRWCKIATTKFCSPSLAVFNMAKSANSGEDDWKQHYLWEISKIPIEQILSAFPKKTIFYCIEKDPDTCHRNLFAGYLSAHLDIEIPEVELRKEEQQTFQMDLFD